ncbi:amidohydrolase family protein [Mangrovicoccus sp. HB161399]|uniref:amidohydrolase family protein n=1 Tax=Mangrovicoccus sp. HB161399 TaxID=2720392 RepID=UPI0015522808|nr:amidohydrolase family protein [Mangrovicoccus sp. HB161399]
MTHPSDFLIEAGVVLCGLDGAGRMQLRHDAMIRVHEGRIAHIGAPEAVAFGNGHLPRFGGPGMIAMPGLVNAHHHFGITPLMGGVPFAPLELWLPRFRLIRQIGPRLDTLYSAIEMLESGTTTVHHIHSGLAGSPEDWKAGADAVLGAYGETGMRAGFSFMIRDRNVLSYDPDEDVLAALPAEMAEWWRPRLSAAATPIGDYMDFFRRMQADWAAKAPGMVRMHLAPANLHWCSDGALQEIVSTARAAGANLHMHLVETERQAAFAQRTFGCSAVEHLHRLGCLGPELTLGHGNWTSRGDLDLLADCGCMICHNASSGLRLGSGIAPVNEMRRRGIPVALGIDQSNIADDRDMLLEMKLAWALHRETGLWNDRPDAAAVIAMATEHGARSAGFGTEVGRLEPGRRADILLLDRARVERPFVSPHTPVAETVLHRAARDAVDSVFVEGRRVVEGGRVTSIDRGAVLAEIGDRLAAPETAGETEARRMVEATMPVLAGFQRRSSPHEAHRPYRYNAMDHG